MKAPTNIKDLEMALRRAFEIDRMLPKVCPKPTGTIIGKMIIIPDDERSYEDIIEDIERNRRNLSMEDIELWENATLWMQKIYGIRYGVVKKRCQGMGWKRIARYCVEKKYSDRMLHRSTLLRYFYDGLDQIVNKS